MSAARHPEFSAHDDALVAREASAFADLARAIAEPDGAPFDLELAIDELVDELIESAEAKIRQREGLEISLTIDEGTASPRVGRVAGVA